MKRYLSFHRVELLAVVLFVGAASALHAQTSANPNASNSTSSRDISAYGVFRQDSRESPLIFPNPEAILGHRLLSKVGTGNTAVQGATDNYIMTASPGAAINRGYFVTDLGTLGGTESFAYAINGLAQVVGASRITGDVSTHAFLYSEGRMIDLSPLNSQSIQTVGPTEINDFGQIGSGNIFGGIYSPAVFDSRTGNLASLGSLGGVTSYGFNGVATSINNLGDAVGYSYIDPITRHAFLYSNGAMTDIDSFGGYSGALAINDQGVIVGFASPQFNGTATAFVSSQGVTTDIFQSGTESYARDVNNRGQVVGDFLIADKSAFHAFLYTDGVVTDIGSLGSPQTVAAAINDQQQVIGTTWVPYNATCSSGVCIQYRQRAFLYEGGNMADLNALIPSGSGWELSWAFDINNDGQIVGYGLVNDKFRAYLLTPVTSTAQCSDGWQTFGFKNQGQCFQFVNTGN